MPNKVIRGRGVALRCRRWSHGSLSDGRNRLLVPFPTFEIDRSAVGAISAGPVVTVSGYLIGLLSRSWTTGNPLAGPAYAVWIVPILLLTFDEGWPRR